MKAPIVSLNDQFELDLGSYELRKSGQVIHLEKTPMELLILLAQKQGQLVTREEIIERLWGDSFVDTRQGINTAIRKIRLATKDDPEKPRVLETVVGKGYRLILSNSATPGPIAGGATIPDGKVAARARVPWLVLAGVAVLCLAIVAYWWRRAPWQLLREYWRHLDTDAHFVQTPVNSEFGRCPCFGGGHLSGW